eukprot:832906-Prorocentrum_lima.AAC.1
MIDGTHALARLDDTWNGFEYTSVQVSVSEGMIPQIGFKQPWTNLDNCHGKCPRRFVMGGKPKK